MGPAFRPDGRVEDFEEWAYWPGGRMPRMPRRPGHDDGLRRDGGQPGRSDPSTSGDLSWLDDAMPPGEDYGFAQTEARTGAYVIGANTYREIGRSGGRVPTYVVTHDAALAGGRNVHPYTGDLAQLMDTVRAEIDPAKDICVFGGGRSPSSSTWAWSTSWHWR